MSWESESQNEMRGENGERTLKDSGLETIKQKNLFFCPFVLFWLCL